MTVLAFPKRLSDAELLAFAFRRAGYVTQDEIFDADETVWQMAADLVRVPLPSTGVRCLVRSMFSEPVGLQTSSDSRESDADLAWGRGAASDSRNNERRNA